MKHRVSEELRQESLARLRELLPPGSTVYAVPRRSSRSGASHRADYYTPNRYHALAYVSGFMWNIGVGNGKHPNADSTRAGLLTGSGPLGVVADLAHALHGASAALRCEVL